jgi:restriction endonuclease S subunit
LIKSIGYIDAVVSRITIAHLTAEKLERIPFIKPPIPVQHRIASYLDKTCAAIDKTIGVKQKQLEILDALRKSIIHKAVTRGLDDSVDLKDSGVEWLGRIPKHWRIEKLKRLLSQPLMYGTNEAAELDDIEYPRYIRITDFGDNGTLKPESFKSLPPDKAEGYYLEEGDLLFARSGATVGKSFLFSNYKGLACFAGYLIRARTSKIKLLPKYLYYFTKSPAYFTWKNVIFTQATIQNISATKYAYLPVSVPSVDEQQLIIQHLDKKMKLLDNMQSNLSDQISTLERYRKSLIHECVTGKRRITEGDVQNQL